MSLRLETLGRFAEPVEFLLRIKGATVGSIAPQATVYNAIALMAEKEIGASPIVEDGALTGMISERDYTRKIVLLFQRSWRAPSPSFCHTTRSMNACGS